MAVYKPLNCIISQKKSSVKTKKMLFSSRFFTRFFISSVQKRIFPKIRPPFTVFSKGKKILGAPFHTEDFPFFKPFIFFVSSLCLTLTKKLSITSKIK